MTRTAMPMFLSVCLAASTTADVRARAEAPELPTGATVRFRGTPGSELSAGWHPGTMLTTKAGCTMIATPDPKMPGGRRVLGLLFMQKLERQAGASWIDVAVKPLVEKEPKRCREAVGG